MLGILSNLFQVTMSPKRGGDRMLESLQHLRSHLWGQNVIKVTQEGRKGFSNVDLTPFGIILNPANGNILLIRDEYGRPDRRGSTLIASDGDTEHCLTGHTLHHAHMYILTISGYLLPPLEHIYVI